jgi:hypothetical protein
MGRIALMFVLVHQTYVWYSGDDGGGFPRPEAAGRAPGTVFREEGGS